MAQEILKILGQSRPAAATETVVYTVPKGARAAISRILLVNNAGGNAVVDFSVVPGGSNDIPGNATAIENTVLNQHVIASNGEIAVNLDKLTLDEQDDIRIETDTLGVVIHVYGVEVIPDKN